ncbi:AAA family ATPase [Halapricum hydrolyticum]|uniref:Replication factor C small subunit n=1 Tax=Halapricum hydrolyticum TaxID=2979991 RepID=A0AAE3LFQ3_9EURY|nr:AAA family ATPase [Halapricum hydrolyticum]MCU4718792.1 AAA family ATPase [Halapricum hydrolyticum]MCU4727800.1 AAA family ATPase [Halapricum hydrolyticum]
MDGPLWTETHAPAIDDLPQQTVRERLGRAREEPMNLFVHGPKGAGKTAAVRALAAEVHEGAENDFIELNVADFFDRSKTEIKNDPRFRSFLSGKSNLPKREMINYVLKESASYTPVGGSYKTILLDNAESMREDFQQALRRVMEQYYEATQFVIATRQPSTLIAPIRSRCFPIPVRAPTHEELVSVLERIVDAEGVAYDEEGLEYVAGYANGDIRTAVLSAQTTAEAEGEITMNTAYEVLGDIEADDEVEAMLAAAEEGRFDDARSTLDDLLVDEGYSGAELMEAILRTAQSRYTGRRLARVHRLAGEIDFDLVEGTDERLHLSHFLASLPAETRA